MGSVLRKIDHDKKSGRRLSRRRLSQLHDHQCTFTWVMA